MYKLTNHFEELLKRTQPPEHRLRMARELPPLVRDYLKRCDEFPTVPPHTRLVGSYAQDMCGGDVKDVDFLVRVEGNPESNEPEPKRLLLSLRKALNGLPEYLGREGDAQFEIEGARRSVHVYFAREDFHLDVVPCIAPNELEDIIYVPDRGFDCWIPTQSVGFIELLNALNQQHNGKVKPLGRLLKHFRNYKMQTRRPKSYWLCALLIHHIREGNLDFDLSLAEIFRDLLNEIYNQYDHLLWTGDSTPNIPDPMLGHNISWNWERSHFETFMRRISEARTWATKALYTDDKSEAIALWQRIFGEEFFPTTLSDEMVRGAMNLPQGIPIVVASGIISSQSQDTAGGVVIPATRFYGENTDPNTE